MSFEERCSALAHNAFSWILCLCYNIALLSAVFELQAVDLVHLVRLCALLFLLFTVQSLSLQIGNRQRYPTEIADGRI